MSLRRKPLNEKELEEIAENLNLSDLSSEYDSDTMSEDNEERLHLFTEYVSEEEDNLEIQTKEDSDQEPSDIEENNEQVNAPVYTSKSGLQWNSRPFLKSKRLRRNIVKTKPGITNYSQYANTILDNFNLFITDAMKEQICQHTNEEACRYFDTWNEKNPTKHIEWRPLEKSELDCFLGVLIKAGALRCRKESTREIWTTNASIRRSFFTAAMSRNRFELIYKFLRFDDKTTRTERKEHDKLAAIRDTWDTFVINCQKSFQPYETVTIDEQLVCFRGKCPFRQYIKSKPGRYGIKIWAAADVKTSYLCNLQVYTGKAAGSQPERNQGFRVVSDLVEPFEGSWRGITTDNFFTSVPLANYLLSKGLTLLGTVRKNKLDTPQVLKTKARPLESSIFAFTKDLTMVSYIPKKNRMVHLLSSQHDEDKVCPEKNNKPYMILDYNETKGGVDNSDKLIREYSCSRKTVRWPFRLFMNVIDIAALNAYVLYIEKNPDWQKNSKSRRRLFLLKLGDELTRNNMENRARTPIQKSYVKLALQDCGIMTVANEPGNILQQVQTKKRGRCCFCPRKKDAKVNTKCDHCKKFVCNDHRSKKETILCHVCKADL